MRPGGVLTTSVARRAVHRLRMGLIAAVAMLVAVSALDHVSTAFLVRQSEGDAELVDLAGRRRMLGQRATRFALEATLGEPTGFAALTARRTLRTLDDTIASIEAKGPFEEPIRGGLRVQHRRDSVLQEAVRRLLDGSSPAALRALQQAAESHLSAAHEMTLMFARRADGKSRSYWWIELALLGVTLIVLGLLSRLAVQPIMRDVTQVVAQLEGAKRRAEEAAEARTKFTANVSHELRTPLNGILGMAGFLLKSELTLRQRHYAKVIDSSARTLRALVDDVLDFSKAQTDSMTVEEMPFDVVREVDRVLSGLIAPAHMQGLEVAVYVDPALDGTVQGDPLRVGQCLANLVSNAIKFTKEGRIIIRAERNGADKVSFTVEDTGLGIAPERANAVFEAFQQADASTTRKYGGTGLGLAIVRRLARLMGGEAGYRPGPNGGSIFYFSAWLPPVAPRLRELDVGGPVLLLGVPTLSRRSAEVWLRAWDVDFVVSDTLEEARAAIEWKSGEDASFVGVLAEASAFGPDEIQALLRENALNAPHVTMLTRVGADLDTADLPASRFSQQPGPVQRDLLLDWLERVVSLSEDVPKARARLRVLLVEDNSINQEVAEAMLDNLGCDVTIANNGQEAVHRYEAGAFDLVFMDWHMPVMDGLEATRELRAGGAQIPIIALTAGTLDDARSACLSAGMDGVLGKPIDPDRLEDVLDRLCAEEGEV